MIELFDTHFHPAGDREPFDITALLPHEKYRIFLMAVGAGFEESVAACRFAEAVDDAWFVCGVHPHGAEEFDGDYGKFTGTFAERKKLKAIGELGLDYFYEEVPGYKHEWDFWDMQLRKALKEWLPLRHAPIYEGEEEA